MPGRAGGDQIRPKSPRGYFCGKCRWCFVSQSGNCRSGERGFRACRIVLRRVALTSFYRISCHHGVPAVCSICKPHCNMVDAQNVNNLTVMITPLQHGVQSPILPPPEDPLPILENWPKPSGAGGWNLSCPQIKCFAFRKTDKRLQNQIQFITNSERAIRKASSRLIFG